MRRLKSVSQARLFEVLHYDPLTGEFVWKDDRSSGRLGEVAGSIRDGYRVIVIDGTAYFAHRLAWLYMTGDWPEEDVDHEDLDRLNNRWSNLRSATRAQNRANTVARSDNRLKIKGVTQKGAKFYAQIQINGKKQYLGIYDNVNDASFAYETAAKAAYGKFARA